MKVIYLTKSVVSRHSRSTFHVHLIPKTPVTFLRVFVVRRALLHLIGDSASHAVLGIIEVGKFVIPPRKR